MRGRCLTRIAAAVLGIALAAQPGMAARGGEQSRDVMFRGIADLFDLEGLPYVKRHKAHMASSYDREGGNYDWANYQRVDGDEGVILDVTGPGMIVRVWFSQCQRNAAHLPGRRPGACRRRGFSNLSGTPAAALGYRAAGERPRGRHQAHAAKEPALGTNDLLRNSLQPGMQGHAVAGPGGLLPV